jgi:hypothetical protein
LSIGYISEQALMQGARGVINNQFLMTGFSIIGFIGFVVFAGKLKFRPISL